MWLNYVCRQTNFCCHWSSKYFPIFPFSREDLSSLFISLMWWIVVPQVASGRQCAQQWSMSLASICNVWPCPTSHAVANHTSCSRSMASIVMPSPRPSARCSAAPPMPSNFFPCPTHLFDQDPAGENKQSSMFLIHMTPSSLNSFTVNSPKC